MLTLRRRREQFLVLIFRAKFQLRTKSVRKQNIGSVFCVMLSIFHMNRRKLCLTRRMRLVEFYLPQSALYELTPHGRRFRLAGASALSRLKIRIDWPQRLQMQEAAAKTGSVDPLSCCDAGRWGVCGQPRGAGARRP